MDRWKSRGGKSQRREENQRKEDAGARKGRKVSIHYVFPRICGSGGSKSRLAKAAGAEPSGQIRDEKRHAPVVRRTFQSQNVQNTPCPEHLWKSRCRKSARRCRAKHISKAKCLKNTACSNHFWRFRCGFAWQAQGILHFAKSEQKTWWFCSSFKNVGSRGTFEEALEKCIRVAGAIQETCSSEMLGGQSADFLRGFAIWSIRSSGLLRWFCVKGATLGMTWPHFFVPGAIL